jgi:hypothetical protein
MSRLRKLKSVFADKRRMVCMLVDAASRSRCDSKSPRKSRPIRRKNHFSDEQPLICK